MKRIRIFFLNCTSFTNFQIIREYLMTKYTVYTAVFSGGLAKFKVQY